jgi:hypothetical protein
MLSDAMLMFDINNRVIYIPEQQRKKSRRKAKEMRKKLIQFKASERE